MKTLWKTLLLLSLACAPAPASAEDAIRLRAGEMSLLEFVEMASERLALSIDASPVEGIADQRVTVPETGPLDGERARSLVLTELALVGYTWIHDGATDLYRIVRQKDARDLEVPLITDPDRIPDTDQLVTAYLPLRHAPPETVARNFRSFMPANSRIIPDVSTASVLVTDTGRNIGKLRVLLRSLDTPEAARDWARAQGERARSADADCPTPPGSLAPMPGVWAWVALFSLIALVIGFLARGYVIRRIEGGL